MASPERRRSFTSAYTDRALLAAAADVVRVAAAGAGDDARMVTRARFDAARADAGHPCLPAAAQIVRRLGVAWAQVRERALADADQTMWLARRGAGAERPGDVAEAVHSLRVVAAALGGSAPTAGQYRRERATLLGADRARHRHGGRLELLGEDQIRAAVGGGWTRALELAGLGAGGAERAGRRRAVSVDAALERCLNYHGALPTGVALDAFAAAHGFALKRRDAPWAQIVERVRERRSVHGLWTPPAPCPKRLAPDFTAMIAASDALAAWKDDPDELRAPKRWDREACVAAALRFLAEAPAATELTERSYADWVAGRPEALPHTSSLQRHGGFAAVTAEARRRHTARPGAVRT